MLHDLTVLEAEDVEADLGAEEVIVRVGEDVVSILEGAHSVHAGGTCGQGGECFAEASQAILNPGIVLDVLAGLITATGALSPVSMLLRSATTCSFLFIGVFACLVDTWSEVQLTSARAVVKRMIALMFLLPAVLFL